MGAADPTAAPLGADPARGGSYWRESVARHERACWRRASLNLATSALPYVLLTVAMYICLEISVWITLALAIPAAGFLLRTFIVFHDCTHGSFVPSRRGNLWIGRITGFLVFQPFANWRHNHAVHHGTAGDLDRRGQGDVATWTLDEYLTRPWKSRLGYKLFRNPVIMFGIGPLWSLMIGPRFWTKEMRPRQVRSVIATNIALFVVLAPIWIFLGPLSWVLVQLPCAIIAGTGGVFLFYVQHQFEDVYWESGENWSYADAALKGSSYLKLPKFFQYFSGNIGLHHVHHLSTKVPNYELQRAHDENEIFHGVPELHFLEGLRALRLKVFDPESKRLLGWREVKARS
jgi:acyl-lipid omega-6 desaturase (Delta-12 desaturase)